MQHGGGISVEDLADETEGFSGADLRAIVSEAQLSAVMAHLERLKAAEAAGGAPDKAAAHETPLVGSAVCPRGCWRIVAVETQAVFATCSLH